MKFLQVCAVAPIVIFASGTLPSSAMAQYNVKGISVSVGTIPTCDGYAPHPTAVAGNIGIYQGTGSNSIDPFRGTPSLAGKSPYIALLGGNITFAPKMPSRFFRILWGSIDPSNVVTFYDVAGNAVGEIQGSDIQSLKVDLAQEYLIMRTPVLFTSVTISTPGTPFEFSDLSFSSKPPICP